MDQLLIALKKVWAVLCLVAALIGTGKALIQVATAFA
jgi:hypothetical protein